MKYQPYRKCCGSMPGWQDIKSAAEKFETDHGEILQSVQPRFYRKTRKPSRKHDWRTRKDPFEHVKDFIELELQLNPNIHAKPILDKLMKKYPEDFYKGHLRTLQRRVSDMRVQQNYREQRYQELMVSKKSMTTETTAGII